jgi:polar amino acid transport system substrate-binding protein
MRRFCCAAAVAFLFAVPARADTIRLVYEPTENPPRYYGATAQVPRDKPGVTIDLFREAARRLNVTLAFDRVPWKRGLFMIETGEADGIFHASYKPERAEFGVYPTLADGDTPDESRAVFFQSYSFYARQEAGVSFDGRKLSGLGGRAVAVTRGYSIIGELKALGVPFEEERSQTLNLTKLDNGRVAAYAELDNMIAPYLADNGGPFSGIVKLRPAISEKAYYLLFSKTFYKNNTKLADAFWNEIRAINNSPLVGEIIGKYR